MAVYTCCWEAKSGCSGSEWDQKEWSNSKMRGATRDRVSRVGTFSSVTAPARQGCEHEMLFVGDRRGREYTEYAANQKESGARRNYHDNRARFGAHELSQAPNANQIDMH